MWSLEETKVRLDRILSRPLTIFEKISRFKESVKLQEHGVIGQKWGVHHQHEPPPPVESPKKDKYAKEPNPRLAGGYFAPNSSRGKVFLDLERADGNWVQMSELAKHLEGKKVSIEDRIRFLRLWGNRTGRWQIEMSDDRARMFMVGKDKRFASAGEKELLEGKVISKKELGGGVNNTYLVELEDGTKAVFKRESKGWGPPLRDNITPGKDAEREVAAWKVAKLVGLEDIVPPTVIRTIDGKQGSFMKFWDGELAGNIRGDRAYDGEKDLARAAVFDYVIGNEDRHMGNWLVSDANKLQLIDHGLSFPDSGDFLYGFRNTKLMQRAGGLENKYLKEASKEFVEKKDEILKELDKVGLPKGAIDGVASGIGRINRKDSWKGLFRL